MMLTLKTLLHSTCIHALKLWVALCEARVQIIDHAILTAAMPKVKEKLVSKRNDVLKSSHHARFRLERLVRQQTGELHRL